jgi:hypothetical protein
MGLLVVSMGIIVENQLQRYPIMGGENVDMCHDHMYVHHTLIGTWLLH